MSSNNNRNQVSEGHNSQGNRYRTFDDGSYSYKNTTQAGHNTNYFHNAKTGDGYYQNTSIGYRSHTYADGSVKQTYTGSNGSKGSGN